MKATPPAYDRLLVEVVRERWYDLLGRTDTPPVTGKVLIRFKLHSDGRVSDIDVVEATVPDLPTLLCAKAIRDCAPFGEWPREMRTTVGADERSMTFTFNYEARQQRTLKDVLILRKN